jgi:glucokinase
MASWPVLNVVAGGDAGTRFEGGLLVERAWALLADTPGDAVLESCWPKDVRHFVVQHLQSARGRQPVEIWCQAPLETARRRFESRHPRHPIHGELMTDAEWERWRVNAQPLQIGPTFQIDTTGPVDADAVIAWINQRAAINPQEPITGAISETQA